VLSKFRAFVIGSRFGFLVAGIQERKAKSIEQEEMPKVPKMPKVSKVQKPKEDRRQKTKDRIRNTEDSRL